MDQVTIDDVPDWGLYLGPLCGDVETAEADLEARSAADQITVTVSRAAAEDYARYGVESAPYAIWQALTEALAAQDGPSAQPRPA